MLLMMYLVNGTEYGKGRASSIKIAKNDASRAALDELRKQFPNAKI